MRAEDVHLVLLLLLSVVLFGPYRRWWIVQNPPFLFIVWACLVGSIALFSFIHAGMHGAFPQMDSLFVADTIAVCLLLPVLRYPVLSTERMCATPSELPEEP